jgi:PAS domain S-box-containing protein
MAAVAKMMDWLRAGPRMLGAADHRLADEMAAHAATKQQLEALQRYEVALRRSHVTVFTQDSNLRYTSVTNAVFGREIGQIVDLMEEDVLPPESRPDIVAMKRACLASGQSRDGEFAVAEGSQQRWYDFHVEPLRDVAGHTCGLSCAAVDITERRESEAHLRMLMRELTHRSKNLLAVIQAMARQTARHAGSIEDFLDRFGGRLQALATAHDLLVQESWHGVSLRDLAHSQLDVYSDCAGPQISIDGPEVRLKPEVAQDLGLAIHELAANAASYGALSVRGGEVSIVWSRLSSPNGQGIEIIWRETGGPEVPQPARRGFGSLAIERNWTRTLDAEVTLAFAPAGVMCRILIPLSRLSQRSAA